MVTSKIDQVEIGVDENGLGPRLGPMTVTGVRVRLQTKQEKGWYSIASSVGITDSKAVCKHGSMDRVEGLVLGILAEHLHVYPKTFDELLNAIGLESRKTLTSLCPNDASSAMCFSKDLALPVFGQGASGEDILSAKKLLDGGVLLEGVRFSTVCNQRINLAKDKGISRFDLDLTQMVLLLDALRGTDKTLHAFLGKVGARKSYLSALQSLGGLISTVEEKKERSVYVVQNFGQVQFVLDGDATEPSIGMASLFGKYARELWMHRINMFWKERVPTAQSSSGYHDPVTDRFVKSVEAVRVKLGIATDCFERKKAGET